LSLFGEGEPLAVGVDRIYNSKSIIYNYRSIIPPRPLLNKSIGVTTPRRGEFSSVLLRPFGAPPPKEDRINTGQPYEWRDKPHPKQGMGWTKGLRYKNKMHPPPPCGHPRLLPRRIEKASDSPIVLPCLPAVGRGEVAPVGDGGGLSGD